MMNADVNAKASVAVMPNDVDRNCIMPSTKIAGFFREFPWLDDYIGDAMPVTQVHVSRISPAVLSLARDGLDSSQACPAQLIICLDAEGEMVSEPVQKKHGWLGFLSKDSAVTGLVNPGETIDKRLMELGKYAGDVQYILWYGRYEWKGRYCGAVILYKAPKGVSLDELIERQIASEAVEYRKAVEAIDAEAA